MRQLIYIDTANIKNGIVTKKLCCSKYEITVSGGVVIATSEVALQVGDRVALGKSGNSYIVLKQTGTTTGNKTIRR